MKATFKLRNKTRRQSGCTLIIDPVRHALGWDVVRQYDCDEGTRLAGSEMVISYDVPTLVQQFSLTSKRAKKLSDLFDSML